MAMVSNVRRRLCAFSRAICGDWLLVNVAAAWVTALTPCSRSISFREIGGSPRPGRRVQGHLTCLDLARYSGLSNGLARRGARLGGRGLSDSSS